MGSGSIEPTGPDPIDLSARYCVTGITVMSNVTGATPETVAVTVAAPVVVPAVKTIVATPWALVTLVADVSVPEPVATVQVTVRPAIGSSFWSSRVTVSGALAVLAVIVWLSPLTMVSSDGIGTNGSSSSSQAAVNTSVNAMAAPASVRVDILRTDCIASSST